MRFDLTSINLKEEITEQLRKQFHEEVSKMVTRGYYDNSDNKKITLFHGTSLQYLNKILMYGLTPRDNTNINNWEEDYKSNSNLVYLTNKWHYYYAYNACRASTNEDTKFINCPCYVEVCVNSNYLVMDEDCVHSSYVKSKVVEAITQRKDKFRIGYEESLKHYGTVAHIGAIPPSKIVSFTLLLNPKTLSEKFMGKSSPYYKEWLDWGQGKGIGRLTFMDLCKLEDDAENLTFNMSDIPENSIITEIIPKDGVNAFSLRFGQVDCIKD